jgi:superfamily I DNA/RNA helicase
MLETTWWTNPEDLDPDQQEVVSLDIDGNHLVLGPPGSGKTNLLILRAAHLYSAGLRNIAVLTFGRVLREFLVAGADNYTFPANRVQTYVRWAIELLAENGIRLDGQKPFNQLRPILLDNLQKLANKASPENRLDCILLGESQDYTIEEINVMRQFSERLFAVGDDRQRIYEPVGSIEALKLIIPSAKTLKYHYRNGIKICRVADGIRGLLDCPDGLEATSNYDETAYPSTVISQGGLPISEQVSAAVPTISTQLRAYPDGIIGVLCPRHKELNPVWEALSSSTLADDIQLQRHADGYDAFHADRRVIVTTTHGAKGLEFRALHLMAMDTIARFREKQRNMSYTAVTRAKTSLTIYHAGPLPGYLEKGLGGAQGSIVQPPKLGDLFKKR